MPLDAFRARSRPQAILAVDLFIDFGKDGEYTTYDDEGNTDLKVLNPYAGYVQAGLVGAFLFVGFSGEAAVFGKGAVRAHVDAKRALKFPPNRA